MGVLFDVRGVRGSFEVKWERGIAFAECGTFKVFSRSFESV